MQTWTLTKAPAAVELVGPHGYIHGWIKVGMDVQHKDGSVGTVRKYDPNTQTAHVDFRSGPRAGKANKSTTKAYHVTAHTGSPEPKAPEAAPPKAATPAAKAGAPTLKAHESLGYKLGPKVAAKDAPEGVTVHKLEGANESHAVFRNGEHIGYINKRSGYSTLGRSGAAYLSKNTGYTAYDLRHNRVALGERTLGDAAATVHRHAPKV